MRPNPDRSLVMHYHHYVISLSWSTKLLYSTPPSYHDDQVGLRFSFDVLKMYLENTFINLLIPIVSEHGSVWRTRLSGHINKIFRLEQHFRQENGNDIQDIETKTSPIKFPAAKLQGPSIILLGWGLINGECLILFVNLYKWILLPKCILIY